jgi:hypothetical protein
MGLTLNVANVLRANDATRSVKKRESKPYRGALHHKRAQQSTAGAPECATTRLGATSGRQHRGHTILPAVIGCKRTGVRVCNGPFNYAVHGCAGTLVEAADEAEGSAASGQSAANRGAAHASTSPRHRRTDTNLPPDGARLSARRSTTTAPHTWGSTSTRTG